TDALSGLYNRRYMETHLASAVDQAHARGKPLALLLLDVDHFKLINDTYGHDAGDDVLREFAIRLRKSIRGIDLACRYGGEESGVVRPETERRVAGTGAERIRDQIAKRAVSDRRRLERDQRDDLDRDCRACRSGGWVGRPAQARRSGAVPRQARRSEPGGRAGRLRAPRSTITLYAEAESRHIKIGIDIDFHARLASLSGQWNYFLSGRGR